MLVGVFEVVVEFFEVAVDGFTRFMVVVGRSFFCCFSNYADKSFKEPFDAITNSTSSEI